MTAPDLPERERAARGGHGDVAPADPLRAFGERRDGVGSGAQPAACRGTLAAIRGFLCARIGDTAGQGRTGRCGGA